MTGLSNHVHYMCDTHIRLLSHCHMQNWIISAHFVHVRDWGMDGIFFTNLDHRTERRDVH